MAARYQGPIFQTITEQLHRSLGIAEQSFHLGRPIASSSYWLSRILAFVEWISLSMLLSLCLPTSNLPLLAFQVILALVSLFITWSIALYCTKIYPGESVQSYYLKKTIRRLFFQLLLLMLLYEAVCVYKVFFAFKFQLLVQPEPGQLDPVMCFHLFVTTALVIAMCIIFADLRGQSIVLVVQLVKDWKANRDLERIKASIWGEMSLF